MSNEQTRTDYSRYILPVGLLLGVYILYNKFFGSGSGTGGNNAATTATTQAGITAAQTAETANGGFTTITTAQAANAANTIFSLGTSGGSPVTSNAQDQIVWQIIEVNTLSDLLLIMQYFGTRAVNTGGFLSLCALANISCSQVSMQSFIHAVLDTAHIATINGYLSDQGINYQF